MMAMSTPMWHVNKSHRHDDKRFTTASSGKMISCAISDIMNAGSDRQANRTYNYNAAGSLQGHRVPV